MTEVQVGLLGIAALLGLIVLRLPIGENRRPLR